jgi:hypothetical protein
MGVTQNLTVSERYESNDKNESNNIPKNCPLKLNPSSNIGCLKFTKLFKLAEIIGCSDGFLNLFSYLDHIASQSSERLSSQKYIKPNLNASNY